VRLTLAAIVVVLALAASACLNSSKPKATHPATTTSQALPAGTVTAACVPAVAGGLSSDFLDSDVSVRSGAVVFVGVVADKGVPPDYRPVAADRYHLTKLLVLVRKGHSALVEVATGQRHTASLVFGRRKASAGQSEPVAYGAPAVLFSTCPTTTTSAWTAYPGAAIVAGARCARLLVTPLKPGTHEPLGDAARVHIPYGRKTCGKHS
jgi:hypothetical protein